MYKTTDLQTFQPGLKKVIYQMQSWTEVRANFETTNFVIALQRFVKISKCKTNGVMSFVPQTCFGKGCAFN